MSVILRSPYNTPTGAGYRYWQDEDFTRYSTEFLDEGVVVATDLAVSEKGTGANMSVDIAIGMCLVEITRSARTHKIYVDNTAIDNVLISNNASGSIRYDIICMKIDVAIDANTAADNVGSLVVVEGTPAAGVPATPANHYKLAEVEVINGAVTIPDAKILDSRNVIATASNLGWVDSVLMNRKNMILEQENMSHVISGASSISYEGCITDYTAGNGAGDDATSYNSNNDWDYDLDLAFSFTAMFDIVGNYDFAWGTGFQVAPSNGVSTSRHLAFFDDDGDIYCSVADGATQNRSGIIAGVSQYELTNYVCVYESGVRAQFYINGALVHTATANLPTAGSLTPCICAQAVTGVNQHFWCYGQPVFTAR